MRYLVTMVAAILVGVFIVLTATIDDEWNIKNWAAFWSVVGVCSFFIALSAWGLVGIELSRLKKKIGELALEDVIISKKSWHYRFNAWINFGEEPSISMVRSECEYWARFFHGLAVVSFIAVFLYAAAILILGCAWFIGKCVTNLTSVRNEGKFIKSGHQFVGPIVLGLAMIGGLVAGLLLSGAWQTIAHVPWVTIGEWSGIVIGGTLGGLLVIFLFAKIAWLILRLLASASRPLFSYASARIVRVCRPVQFID